MADLVRFLFGVGKESGFFGAFFKAILVGGGQKNREKASREIKVGKSQI